MSKFSFDPKQLSDIFAKQSHTPHGKSVLKSAAENKNNSQAGFGYNPLRFLYLRNEYYGAPHYMISSSHHWNEGGIDHGDGWNAGPPDYSKQIRLGNIPEAAIEPYAKLITTAIVSEATLSFQGRDVAFVKPHFKKRHEGYDYDLFHADHVMRLKTDKNSLTRLHDHDAVTKKLNENIVSFIHASNDFQKRYDDLLHAYGTSIGLRARY